MKIKTDFVTNSSSTSFIVLGCGFDVSLLLSAMPKILELLPEKDAKDMEQYVHKIVGDSDFEDLDIESREERELTEIFETYILKAVNKAPLKLSFSDGNPNDDGGTLYMGVDPIDIPEDITIAEAKKALSAQLALVGLRCENPEFISMSWYDG